MIRQFELVERVKAYDPGADEEVLNRAYVFAMKVHGSQTRLSGDPYFSHPLEVAGILTEYKVDLASIITALLHDTVEDTETTLKEIKKSFGKDVSLLVDGVTKLTRIEFQSDLAKQAENFRKFVLAMSEDIRVLLVKLADRLHNMRTLHYIKNPGKRRRIAMETMDIYAPLAERIGMQAMKNELEDLAFGELNTDARNSIIKRLNFLREKGGDIIPRIITELEKTLADKGIKAVIVGREKTPYSVWDKMQDQDLGFEQLSDIMAFRVIVDTVEDCYLTLGVAHGAYPVGPFQGLPVNAKTEWIPLTPYRGFRAGTPTYRAANPNRRDARCRRTRRRRALGLQKRRWEGQKRWRRSSIPMAPRTPGHHGACRRTGRVS
jgi:GTP pyrophosphokinase